MKKLILIAIAFISLNAVAQDKKREHSKKDAKEKRELAKDLSADEIATLGSKKMTLALDLSDKQQAQVKEILLEQATSRKQKMAEREKSKNDANAKKPTKEERIKMMNSKLDNQIAMKQKMKTILTPEQYEKWENMQGKRGQKGNKKQKNKRKN
jgi:hypothetical protein|nr:hypothetical protein [uncultured Psychroserpens sp.]